jgi:hypothetical protein
VPRARLDITDCPSGLREWTGLHDNGLHGDGGRNVLFLGSLTPARGYEGKRRDREAEPECVGVH